MGDLLFVLVNLARFVKVDPEQALRQHQRQVPPALRLHRDANWPSAGKTPEDSNIEEMEALWQEAKRVIELRKLTDGSPDSRSAVALQQTIWGFADIELLPLRFFVVASQVGGQVFGAYDGDTMVGFCLAHPRHQAGRPRRTCTATCWACCRNIATRASAAR